MTHTGKKQLPPCVLKFSETECGSSLVELAVLAPILCFLFVGAADFGRAYFFATVVSRCAYTAALYGSQNPSDTAGTQQAALADATDLPGFTTSNVSVLTGCECSDGTLASASCSASPSCAANLVNYVEVDTSYSYTAILPYPGIVSPLTLHGSARMRSVH